MAPFSAAQKLNFQSFDQTLLTHRATNFNICNDMFSQFQIQAQAENILLLGNYKARRSLSHVIVSQTIRVWFTQVIWLAIDGKSFEDRTWIVPESSLMVMKTSFPNALRATILPAMETDASVQTSPFSRWVYLSWSSLVVWVLSHLYAYGS